MTETSGEDACKTSVYTYILLVTLSFLIYMTLESGLKKVVPIFATLFTMAYTPAAPGWGTLLEHIENKQGGLVIQDIVAGFSGVRLKGGGQGQTDIDLFGTLNPIDFTNAPYGKVAGWTSVAMTGIGKVRTFVNGIISDVLG